MKQRNSTEGVTSEPPPASGIYSSTQMLEGGLLLPGRALLLEGFFVFGIDCEAAM